jgi:hypothetical protein
MKIRNQVDLGFSMSFHVPCYRKSGQVPLNGGGWRLALSACQIGGARAGCGVRLFQDQIYQKGVNFIRIVRLDRYQVEYKATVDSPKAEGPVVVAAKKEFCRLLKGMSLVVPEKRVEAVKSPDDVGAAKRAGA